jgi:threonine dehydratase
MRNSGGTTLVATEEFIANAHKFALENTTIPVSATGSAGLAGLLSLPPNNRSSAIIFSGVER